MVHTVMNARVRNIAPGVLYTMIFHQNGAGGHSFRWPAQCQNAGNIATAAYATTVQNFIGIAGGRMDGNIGPTWH
jgi:hypothetical protein